MKKTFIFSIAAFALLLALISFDTASNNNVFEIVVNNTNLAPDAGAPHPPGTGERVSGTLYYTNISPIQILIESHASSPGQNGSIILSINGTEVLDTSIRPIGAAEDTHTALSAIIPKGANYSANFSNYHHYEWREYPILSGRNGTLSIIQNVTGSSVDNGTIQINESQVNNLVTDLNSKVNKSGNETITGNMTFLGNITILDTKYNMTMQEMNLEYSLVPRFHRNSTLTGTRTSPLATINMILSTAGTVGNGGGAAMIFWNKENNSEGNFERNIGRAAVVWQNKTLNTSKVEFYARDGVGDSNGLTPVLSAYTAQNNILNQGGLGTGDALINSTLETGNLKLLNNTGTGNAYLCINLTTDTIYAGNPTC